MDEDMEHLMVDFGKKFSLEVYKMRISDTRYEILFDRIL